MLLAGDVGGTKTLLGLFRNIEPRPAPIATETFRTLDHPDLGALCLDFVRSAGTDPRDVEGACFGVAGPVKDGRARLTNVPWDVDVAAISRTLSIARTHVINDLEALAWGVTVLADSEVESLSRGESSATGGAALLAAGTGLGVALLPKVDGRFVPVPSEGGHADFAARNAVEERLRSALTETFGRAELEQVLSGPGLFNIHRFIYPHTCRDLAGVDVDDMPAGISRAAIETGCPECRQSMELFVSVYGAAAGNLALTALSTGGLFIGGGIAPRILPALRWPVFLESFFSKAPLDGLMQRIPVKVILNTEAGLLGAATFLTAAEGEKEKGRRKKE